MTARRVAVVLNGAAGTLAQLDAATVAADIAEAFLAAGGRADVVVSSPVDLDRDISRAAENPDFEAVIVGGGDGTISRAARILSDAGRPMGVLPLGTLNLFARDLGIPIDLDAAVAAMLEADFRDVDTGWVDEHLFLSNATLGIYPMMVKARERRRDRSGWSKWPAMMWAAFAAFRRPRRLQLSFEHEGRLRVVRTAVFIVSNNRVADSFGPYLTRESVNSGELALYVARARTGWGLLRLALGAIAGRVNDNPDLMSMGGTAAIVVRGRRSSYPVALDGEVVELRSPMSFSIRPGSLTVLAPRPASEDEAPSREDTRGSDTGA